MTALVPLFRLDPSTATTALGAMERTIAGGRLILGPEVEAFERNFAAYCGVAHAVGVGNGTDALELALRALGVAAGDRVVLAANAGGYGSIALRAIGAEPQYADINPHCQTLAVAALATALATRPRALLVTHLYGRLADIEAIVALADHHGVPVIEDCAQAHGAARGGKHAGSFGRLGCFSFYPTKNLGALGDGGAVVTADPQLAERLRALRQYGWTAKYRVTHAGGRNSRLDELQAAILNDRLPGLDADNHRRREIAERYRQAFTGLPMLLPAPAGNDYVAHLYVVRLAERDRFRTYLGGLGIASEIHYPIPDHRQPTATAADSPIPDLPETERACASVVSLPCFPGLRNDEIGRVINAVRRYFDAPDAGQC